MAVTFRQAIGAGDALRTGDVLRSPTFTLSTANPWILGLCGALWRPPLPPDVETRRLVMKMEGRTAAGLLAVLGCLGADSAHAATPVDRELRAALEDGPPGGRLTGPNEISWASRA